MAGWLVSSVHTISPSRLGARCRGLGVAPSATPAALGSAGSRPCRPTRNLAPTSRDLTGSDAASIVDRLRLVHAAQEGRLFASLSANSAESATASGAARGYRRSPRHSALRAGGGALCSSRPLRARCLRVRTVEGLRSGQGKVDVAGSHARSATRHPSGRSLAVSGDGRAPVDADEERRLAGVSTFRRVKRGRRSAGR